MTTQRTEPPGFNTDGKKPGSFSFPGRRLLALALCFFALSACLPADCPNFAPLASGTFLDHGLFKSETTVATEQKAKSKSWKLSPAQLLDLSAWLAVRNSGWQTWLPSPLPASGAILLKHNDGRVSQISLFTVQASWQTTLQIYSKSPEGEVFRGEYNLSKEELRELLGALRQDLGVKES